MKEKWAIPAALKGPLWMFWSGLLSIAVWGLIRVSSETLHPFVIVFYRTLFATLMFAPFLLKHGLKALKSKHINQHAWRGLLSLFVTLGLFYAVANIPLAEAVAINYSAPVFAAVGVILFLKEKAHWPRITAIILGFIGVLIVMRPGFQELTPGIWAAFLGSLFFAASLVLTKSLSNTDRPELIALYSFLFMLPPSFIVALFFWTWPTAEEMMILITIGILVSLTQTALARAFVHSEATAVLPIDFSRLIFATILGFLAFEEKVDVYSWAGAAVILGSTVYVAHREARRKKSSITNGLVDANREV